MNRLKFRVWDGTKMEYNVTVGKFGVFYVNPGDKGDGLDPKDSGSLTRFNTKYSEGITVMQFTDSLDKDGKEIWEKDVVEMAGGLHGVVEWNKYLSLFEIIIHDDGKTFSATIYSNQEDSKNTNRKVIGNAFENYIY